MTSVGSPACTAVSVFLCKPSWLSLVLAFRRMVRDRDADTLDRWLIGAHGSGIV